MRNNQSFEKLVFQEGSRLLKQSRKQEALFLKKNWWYQKMLSWVMSNAKLKTSLFRFIDVLPSLSDDKQFLSHFKEYFKGQELAFITSGLGRLAPSLMVKNVKKQISQVAKMFITGSNVEEALKIISKNWEKNRAFSMDILGEATLSEKEAENYFQRYFSLMDRLLKSSQNWQKKEILQRDSFGPIPSVNISIKASSLFSQIKTEAWDYSKSHLKDRLRPLFQKAVKNFVFVNLDMEQYQYKTLFLEIFKELIMEEELRDYPHFGVVIQTYLKDSFEDLKDLSQFVRKRGEKVTVRLVKGAYWDSEVLLARQKNWPLPVYTRKEETDANFERCLQWLFENSSQIKIALGTHNIRSIACALSWHRQYPKAQLEFQILYGMGEGLAQALIDRAYCVRLYCTTGELIPGMSYLVRRLLENSANQSFILNSFLKNRTPEVLLAPPRADLKRSDVSYSNHSESDKTPHLKTKKKFTNHPLLDFSKADNREGFQKALSYWKSKFPLQVPVVLEGKKFQSPQTFKRENPAQTDQTVSLSFMAQKEQAEQAVQYTSSFFAHWSQCSPYDRISCLKNLAELMKKREFELSALQVFEVGKTWPEAQADVAEAIDFCNYYALSYEELIKRKSTDEVAGEDSFFCFEAVGPTAVIAPWNFPLAILTGMTVAPLLCGNTVLIKPAEQSPLTAFQLAKMLLESGFPKESFAFLPGKGEELGEYLVQHPEISVISFTGSFEVGSQIIKQASHISPGQKNIKKCVVEMGGKNAIVIDSSADLDEAISGVLTSAFGFQGQKCSAASRLIVLEDVYDPFIQRFLPAVESLAVGQPENPCFSLGPLIDQNSRNRVKTFINREKSRKLFGPSFKDSDRAWFCPPLVYLTDQKDSTLMQEELFAPVLAVFKVKDFDSAIRHVNSVRFGLTASCYSRHPVHIEKFQTAVEVGNLYINRNCTGALVKRHPFGGRKMSGLGSKTGGPEYLKQFLHTKIITENSIRRGFAPELFGEGFFSADS